MELQFVIEQVCFVRGQTQCLGEEPSRLYVHVLGDVMFVQLRRVERQRVSRQRLRTVLTGRGVDGTGLKKKQDKFLKYAQDVFMKAQKTVSRHPPKGCLSCWILLGNHFFPTGKKASGFFLSENKAEKCKRGHPLGFIIIHSVAIKLEGGPFGGTKN